MFQITFAYIIQADREREIAELNRQRRLLKREPGAPAPDRMVAKSNQDARPPCVDARVAGG